MTVTIATELLHKGLWYPTILGVLVVVAGIALFCGSIYVLLGTNLGARLGFLVAFTWLMGFMTILTALWCTTASPLNTLKGRIPAWEVQQVVTNLLMNAVQAMPGGGVVSVELDDVHAKPPADRDTDEGEFLRLRVRDQGNGFDPTALKYPLSPENMLKASGRGIFLIRQFMDDVSITPARQGGTEMRMSKRIRASE